MSMLTISISLTIIGLAMWFLSPSSLFGYIIGVAFGILLMLSVIRKLGRKSQYSTVATKLFYRLTKYRARFYTIERTPHNIVVKVYGDDDSMNLMDILKNQMGFPVERVKDAIKHAVEVASDKPLEERLREALKFLDRENNYKTITKEA